MMKSRAVLPVSLLLAMLLPLMVLGSSGCGRSTNTLENVWTRQFGTSGLDHVRAMVADGSGNIYVSGGIYLQGGLVTEGYDDAFIAKYDASGNEMWTRRFATGKNEVVSAMVADGSGNICVAGSTCGAFPGQTSLGMDDAFITKYDASGNEIWTRQFGTSDWDYANAIVIDGSGNIYVTGDTYLFPDQPWPVGGDNDALIAKYDTLGNEIWTRQFGTSQTESVNTIAVDGSGNIYMAGSTWGTTRVTSVGQSLLVNEDAFIAKYDTSGNEVWTRQFGASDNDRVNAMVADGSGNIYVGGSIYSLGGETSQGWHDAFIGKYDTSGNEVWMRQFDNLVIMYPYVMVADGEGNICVARTVYEYPSSFLTCLSYGTDPEGSHVLITKYDNSGEEVWAGKSATDDWDTVHAVVADGSGNIYVAGDTCGTLAGQTSSWDCDLFIMKLRD